MEIVITAKAKEDLAYWKKRGNISVQNKITKLIDSIIINPFDGLGKPGTLKI